MKLDYNVMQPGQEFWATYYGGALHCIFTKIEDTKLGIDVSFTVNGIPHSFFYFEDLGIDIPFSTKKEALEKRMEILEEITKKEVEKIKEEIRELEAENDLHQ